MSFRFAGTWMSISDERNKNGVPVNIEMLASIIAMVVHNFRRISISRNDTIPSSCRGSMLRPIDMAILTTVLMRGPQVSSSRQVAASMRLAKTIILSVLSEVSEGEKRKVVLFRHVSAPRKYFLKASSSPGVAFTPLDRWKPKPSMTRNCASQPSSTFAGFSQNCFNS